MQSRAIYWFRGCFSTLRSEILLFIWIPDAALLGRHLMQDVTLPVSRNVTQGSGNSGKVGCLVFQAQSESLLRQTVGGVIQGELPPLPFWCPRQYKTAAAKQLRSTLTVDCQIILSHVSYLRACRCARLYGIATLISRSYKRCSGASSVMALAPTPSRFDFLSDVVRKR